MATPPDGTKLSLGKLGRATAVGNSDYTSRTSLNSAGRDSGTGKTSLGDFFIGSVDDSLDGFQFVDEQTNETYTLTFGDENSLFQSRIGGRHQNFTWASNNDSLFGPQDDQDYNAVYEAGAITDTGNFVSKSFESNLVTDGDFNAWADANTLNNWYESGGSVITRTSITTAPSSSNAFAVRFDSQDSFLTQSFTVKGNSTYEIVAHLSSSNVGEGNIDFEISGAYSQQTFTGICGNGEWNKFRNDFYTSGSSGTSQNLQLKFTAVSASNDHKPLLDSVFFRRWEGANFSDSEVIISGKYHDAGQSDGFNDHATRYNTAIQKTVEIQDTYGGLSSACFLPGTLINMFDGTTKLVENLNVGDEVLSLDLPGLPDEDLGREVWMPYTMRPMDATDLSTLVNSKKTSAFVESLFYDFQDGYYDINNGEIKVTKAHEFWVFQEGLWRWKRANELEVGSLLLTQSGETLNIDSIEYVDGEVEVIQFDVEPLDVYFAAGVLVHNKGTDSDPA